MALTLLTTLSDQAANSYVSAAYCDTYWEQHYLPLKADLWAGLEDPQKVSVLLHACRVLETIRFTQRDDRDSGYVYNYDRRTGTYIGLNNSVIPTKADYSQALQFPRNLDRDIDTGALYIPEPVLNAQCEQAVYLLSFDESAIASQLQGISYEHTGVGPIAVTQKFSGVGSMLAPVALSMISPLIMRSNSKLRRA